MRTYLALLTVTLAVSSAVAQDPGMLAAQQAQIATQAVQQANDQMMPAAEQANQAMVQSAEQAAQNVHQCYYCYAAKPEFSVKPGAYSAAVTLEISTRGGVIYYTIDGWTPTAASTRYTGRITISATTTLQAIAVSPYGGRSRVTTATYSLNGVLPTARLALQTRVQRRRTSEAKFL